MEERIKPNNDEVACQLATLRQMGLHIETIDIGDLTFSYANQKEFFKIYRDIFERQEYYFHTENDSPMIIDCGAHIGLATLYFKGLYPRASVVCFEPNPKTFEILKLNLLQNRLIRVAPINAALASDELPRYLNVSNDNNSPWSWDDSCVLPKWNEPASCIRVVVCSTRLSSYLTQPIDFLKIDIEGMETEILGEIQDRMYLIKELVIEFHVQKSNLENNLDEMLDIFKRAGFDISIRQDCKPVRREEIGRSEPYWLLISAKRRY